MSIPPLVKKICFVLFLSPLLLFLNCGPQEAWQSASFFSFDTVCEIHLRCPRSKFHLAQEEVERLFAEIENHFSPGKQDLSSCLVIGLYRRALDVYRQSDGCFDITVGPLTRLWGFLDRPYHIPSPRELKKVLNLVGMEKIKEYEQNLILDPGMELDWGGIAKGLGLDLAYNALLSMGVDRGYINAGGDLACWGKNPDNEDWKVGIKHPRRRGYLGILSISGVAAATTGDYQRFFEEKGIRYHHIFDPRTGYPAQGKRSVTVIGPEALICDALSTALFVSEKPGHILDKYPQYGSLIVDSEGKISILGNPYPFRLL